MIRCSILAGVLSLGVVATLSFGGQIPLPSGQTAEKGVITERVVCLKRPEQSYVLFLPSNYSRERSWPIVYSFDPAARGKLPVELQMKAAERYGYILAASNNSRNGPWKGEVEAAEAMMEDTQSRLSIDQRRMYFAGFSGGARLASQLATLCKCAGGVFLSGAGFASGREPSKDSSFAVFSAVGTLDFNYQEVIPLQVRLAQVGFPRWLRIFEGPHQWAPAETMDEALGWFQIQAMKSKLAPLDDAFIQDQFAKSAARADSFVQSKDFLGAYREYAQIAATYDGLADVDAIRAKADGLGKAKSVRDALKQEKNDFDEQTHLTEEISAALTTNPAAGSGASLTNPTAEQQVQLLREHTERETYPDRAKVLKRTLSGLFIESVELGSDALKQKDFALALRAFRFATQASPRSEWAWENLAVAEANTGSRKEMLNALTHAREFVEDKTGFAEWLKREPSFDRYRDSSDFQKLAKAD